MLKIINMDFRYANGHKVFSGMNLEIGENKIYGLLGKNGTGKSTLLYLISGLLTPQKGEVLFDSMNTRRRLPQTLCELFLVPDEFDFPSMTLAKYVKLYSPFYPNFSQEKLDECLKDFEVEDVKELTKLSLGQKKKVFVSFALATGVKLLMMDEPTNGLDIPSKDAFRKIVAKHMGEGQTIIISTHLVHDVEPLLDHLLIMREDGTFYDRETFDVTADYAFDYRTQAEGDDVVYAEPSPQGFAVIARNTGGRHTQINLDLLFKAVASGAVK